MLHKIFFSLILITIFLNACNLTRKSGSIAANTDLPVIPLDTVEASAKIPEIQSYQSSATRLNDIIHTKLDVSFDWAKQYMFGKATITVKPYFYPTATLELDARGMEIKEVDMVQRIVHQARASEGGINYEPAPDEITRMPVQYTYENDIISIKLDKEYKSTEEYTVFIDYISKPNELKSKGGGEAITNDKGLYFINPDGKDKNKPKEIWTQGETESNSVWFPTIDHPNERMTQEINITVDKKYVTLSNGELMFSTDNGDSTRTDYWKMDLPHAPYLAMMAIGDFAVVKDKWRDKEVNYYVERKYEPYAKAIFGNTPEMIEFFSTKFGVPFAWNKYDQVVVRDYVSGAMENTTATLFGEYMQRTDRELLDNSNEDVIAHELSHHWFGDLVTCESWSNLPLNESFATYAEYLWEEYKYGLDAADEHSEESREEYLSEASRKQLNLIRFQYDNENDMFDRHSYNKGGQVLHMLRKYVGDDAFFASLKLYLETNKFNSVEIHNLRLAFEQVTGEDLNWFFNQWFLSSGHPDLIIKTDYDAVNKKQKVEIKQVQDFSKTPLFKLPIGIDIYANGKTVRHKITVTKSDETFEFDAATRPDLVNVDAEKMLLCTKNESKSVKEWSFQYFHAPLLLDRFEALLGLSKNVGDSLAAQTIIAALDDKYRSLRLGAMFLLNQIQADFVKNLKDKLTTLAEKDEDSHIRAAALDFLPLYYKEDDLMTIYKSALNDKSYSVLAKAFAAISKVNPGEGLIVAKHYENENNSEILYAIANLYASDGSAENNTFFIKSSEKFTGYSKISFISLDGVILKKVKNDETVNEGGALLAGIAKEEESNKWVAYFAKKTIYDLTIIYEDKAASLSQELKTLKATNASDPDIKALESQIEKVKAQEQRIMEIYNGLK